MRAGALRQLLTIQRKVQVGTSALNEPNMVWQDWLVDIFCEVTVRRGREHFDVQTKQRFSEDVWLFRVRYDEIVGLDPTMQILHADMKFDIRSPRPDAQFGRDCVIECTVQNALLGAAPLSISITELISDGVVGQPYGGFTITANGGQAPYSFIEESGSLPPGLFLDSSTGAVAGTPASAGEFSVDIQVNDAAGAHAALPAFLITVTT
ncbi:putative Ig domain-containing protein [Mesorhizobium sp. M0189]|uniref:phage head completion protein n=1 Tax=Mesorhizobium sp. M0189 TaxID=2956909 RepID=UPI00333C0D7E